MVNERFGRVKDLHDREFKFRRRARDFAHWGWDHGFREGPSPMIEPYTIEDELLDQLGRLPSPEIVELLITQLRNPELRELAVGVINDITEATKRADNIGVMKAINSWMATAAEPLASRRKIRHILAARERGRIRSGT